jgi:hypothetical protein
MAVGSGGKLNGEHSPQDRLKRLLFRLQVRRPGAAGALQMFIERTVDEALQQLGMNVVRAGDRNLSRCLRPVGVMRLVDLVLLVG